ncbi:MAG: N-acetylmuramoyl-L-alanine amidase [Parvularculaceae bacterium]|nr:N-acetylmuramoyl-L-alanine amidase [Parvularculaceae bacterium]
MLSPQDFQFDLPRDRRPPLAPLPERWAPGMPGAALAASSERTDPFPDGVRAIVVHATAGGSSAGALSVIRPGGASFHWLVPAEGEDAHGRFVWACVPERRAAWHVRNACAHKAVCGGARRINHASLGIEIVNRMRANDPYSEWQMDATAAIIRYAWAKYPELVHVVSHARLDPARRTDPGAHFPWTELERRVLSGA